jgi:hypothetical protein
MYKKTKPNKAGLGAMSGDKAALAKAVDTETNDLASTIMAIDQTLKAGITDEATVNKLINWTTVSVNILNRMIKDIVLEEQMLDKL